MKMLIAGIICTIVAWGVLQQLNAGNVGSGYGVASMAIMVLAYVLVIGAFIYDLWKVRPMRRAADEQVAGMSKRRMQRVLEEEKERKASNK
jgi:type VI protein secretion system component VasK